jgi:hypothetical protein
LHQTSKFWSRGSYGGPRWRCSYISLKFLSLKYLSLKFVLRKHFLIQNPSYDSWFHQNILTSVYINNLYKLYFAIHSQR